MRLRGKPGAGAPGSAKGTDGGAGGAVPAVGGGAGRRVRVLKDRSGSLGSSIIASKGGGNSVLRRPTRGECVASLRVILYDLKVPRAPSGGSTSDADLQYGCVLSVGNKAILPSNVFVPLSTQPTCLGSHINFPVQSLESKLRVTVVDTETNHAMGVVSIPLKDIPFVHESMAFGLAKYYEFKPTSKDGITSVPGGMLRIGLKLLKQRHPTRKLGEWRGKSAGGCLNNHTWVDNPQYWLSVSVRSIISVNLQSTLGKENQLGFYIIKIAELSELVRKRKAQEEDVVKSGDYFSWMERGSESVSKEVYILPGSYIIVPCVKYPGVEGVFQLTIVGDYDAGLKIDSFDEDQLEGEVEWLSSDDESSDVSSGSDSAASKAPKRVVIKTEKKKQKEEKRRQLQQALLMKYGSMGNVNRLKLTLEKTRDVNAEGISALTFAARNGHFDCVSLLVGKGAEINKTDNEGVNALLMAATGGHADILKFLLSHKETDILARDPVGNAALPLACASGSLECVELLLEKGSLVHQTNDQRQTPLMRAAAGGHADIVHRLIKKGAKANFKDTSGQTALHYACTGGSLECVKQLLAHGADMMEKDRNGETALFKASFRGHLDILRLLIEQGEKESSKHQNQQGTNGGLRAAGANSSQHFISQKSKLREWDTITLLLEPNDAEEEEARERALRQMRDRLDMKSSDSGGESTTTTVTAASTGLGDSNSSSAISHQQQHNKKRHVLDVLIVLMKHGKRRSAFQLISTEGMVKSSNLVLEREEEDSGNGDQSGDGDGGRDGGGAVGGSGGAHYNEALSSSSPMPTKANTLERDKDKDKKKDSKKKDKKSKKEKEDNKKKEKAQKKDGKDKVPALALATDPLVEVIAKGQLEILCLLIEKGDMGNYLQNMSLSTLLYDLVDQHTFDCLLAQFEGVLATPGQDDERTKKRLKHRSRSLSPRKDGGADEVRQLSLAMFSPLTGPFGCVLAAVDGVSLTVVNCIDHADSAKDTIDLKKNSADPGTPRTPRGTPIAMQSSMRRFIKAGYMDLLGVLFNTRRALLSSSHSIQTTAGGRKKKASVNRQLFVWIREAKDLVASVDGESVVHKSNNHHHHQTKSNGDASAELEKARSEKKKESIDVKASKEQAAIPEAREGGLSPYCEVKWGKAAQRTGVRKLDEQPRWFERFHFDLGDPLADQRLEVSVFDTNKSSDKAGHFPLLGRLEISLGDIMRDADRGRIGPKWFPLQDKEGNATGGNLCMQLNVQLLASSSPHK